MTSDFFENYLRQFNAHIQHTVGEKVLLLIDNAPSHAYRHLDLSHVEVQPLPPNTTSKIQPLDAGIISSFKRHYRKRQLDHAVEILENREVIERPQGRRVGADRPFKVDQLTAMRWAQSAWREIDQSVFRNCWAHTTLLDHLFPRASSPEPLIQPEDEELVQIMDTLHLHNPMAIDDFLNPRAESDLEIHRILSDEELVAAARMQEEDDGQEEAELDAAPLVEYFTREAKVKAFTIVTAVLEASEDLDSEDVKCMLKRLRKCQNKIREDSRVEKELRARQTLISSFF
jgi:hypothetical protein